MKLNSTNYDDQNNDSPNNYTAKDRQPTTVSMTKAK
jgi:hypothetical protein